MLRELVEVAERGLRVARAQRSQTPCVQRASRIGSERDQRVGRLTCRRQIAAHQLDGNQVRARGEETRIARDRCLEGRSRVVELSESGLRNSEIVVGR